MRDEHNMHGTAKGHGRHRVHGKHESRRTSPRPAHLLGVVAALTLVGGTLLAVQVFPDNRPPSATAATATATTPEGQPTSRAAATPGRIATGPGADQPGIRFLATPGTDGEVEVVEQILLPTPSTQLRFGPAATAGISGLQDLQPVLHQIQATADGQVVAVPSADAIDRPVDVTLAQPATAIALRYRLGGAVHRSQPAPPGRALIALASAMTQPAGPPVVVEVSGARVHNMQCPLLPVNQQLCGREDGQSWATPPVPSGQAVVLVQVDLPTPGAATEG